MNLSSYKKVLQHSARMGMLISLLAVSALAAQAQVVFSPVIKVSHDIDSPGEPQVAVDSAGNINTVWSDQTTACGSASCTISIFFSRSTDGGATFSAPLNISNDQGTSTVPQIALDPRGNINVIWSDNSPGYPAVFFSRSVDGGHTFSTPTNISAPSGGFLNQLRPRIAVDSSGNISVGWWQNGGNIMFTHSSDGGANFSAPVSLGTGAAAGPSVVVDSAGSVNVLWEAAVSGHNPFDVFYTRSTDGGASFSTPVDVTTIPDGAAYEQVAVAPDGSVDVIWMSDCENTYFSTCPAYPSSAVFFAQSKDNGATFSAPANLSNTPTGTSIGNVRMVVTSSGNVDIVWSAVNTGQISTFFRGSTDGGVSFSAPTQIANAFASQMAADSNGNIDVAVDTTNNVQVVRSTDGGGSFSLTNVSAASVSGVPRELVIATDASGDISVVWPNYNPNTFKWGIFFSRGIVVSLSALGLSPADVTGGSSSTGTVTMNGPAPTGGAVISLSIGDPSVSVPATVTIPEGTTSATFTVTTTPVASATTAVITAAFGGVTQTATITVEPPVLTSLTLNPSSTTGGSSSTGTVTLTGPASAGGAVVALSSSNTSVATVPSSITVSPGFTNATFTVSTSPVLCSNAATISASFSGVTLTANLTVLPLVTLPPQACAVIGPHRPATVSGQRTRK
jgi:hypothetical protein